MTETKKRLGRLFNSQRKVTIAFTFLIVLLFAVYTYSAVIKGGNASGVSIPLILYMLYISIFYGFRWGFPVAVIIWALVIFFYAQPPMTIKLDQTTLISFLWASLIPIAGSFMRKVHLKHAEEILQREKYSATAAHELKNPLSVVLLNAGMLEKTNPVMAKRLKGQVARIQTITNRMMDFSKVTSGNYKLHFTNFYLRDVIRRFISDVKKTYPNVKISLKVPKHRIRLYADQYAVEQIVSNLINNAVKYGGKKPIRVSIEKNKSSYILLQVSDKGPGIPSLIQKHIFEPFRQGDSSAQGLGVGLFITKQLVELHDGTIDFRTSSKGTTFIVKLPIN